MIPVQFLEANAVLASRQENYEPLPVYVFAGEERVMAFCFRLSPAELEQIARTKTLWIRQLTFGAPFQPIVLSTQRPEGMPHETD